MSTDGRSVTELFSDALNQFGKLIRSEIQLARAEVAAKATQAAMGVGMLVGASMFVIPALVLLLIALAIWFSELGLPDPVAYLLAAVIGFVISGVLAWLGMNRLKPENLAPQRTVHELQQDAAAAREQVK